MWCFFNADFAFYRAVYIRGNRPVNGTHPNVTRSAGFLIEKRKTPPFFLGKILHIG